MVERMLHREHAAPRLADHGVPVGDADMERELCELVLEELRRPELRRRVGKVAALAAADLVVEHAPAPEPAQLRDRLRVVMRRARAAVTDDDRRRAGIEVTHDAVPRLVSVPRHASFRHLMLLSRAAGGGTPRSDPCHGLRAAGAGPDKSRLRTSSADGSGSRSADRSGSGPRPRARSAPPARFLS